MGLADTTVSHEYIRPRSFFAVTLGMFAASFGLSLVLRYYSLFPSVIDSDESLYLIIAQQWLRGALPYQSVWDQHSEGCLHSSPLFSSSSPDRWLRYA